MLVFNKIDRGGNEVELRAALRAQYPAAVVMSARRAGDIAKLRETIVAFFRRDLVEAELFLPWSAQNLRGEIFANCEVLEERAEKRRRVVPCARRAAGREAPAQAGRRDRPGQAGKARGAPETGPDDLLNRFHMA